MAVVRVTPGKTDVQATARARGNTIPPEMLAVPGGLYPLMSAAFEVDEYRIMAGWPVPVPPCDIRIDCLVTGDGVGVTNRIGNTELITKADLRWVVDPDYYDQTSLQWKPFQGNSSPWTFGSSTGPTFVSDYEYSNGDEKFIGVHALNFDSDTGDFMEIDLDRTMGGTTGYTLIMVMNPSSIYGNATVDENVLWGPQDTSGAWYQLSIRDRAVWLKTESLPPAKGVAIGEGMLNTAPTYLAIVFSTPQATLYAASGPSRVLSQALPSGTTPEPLSTRFWLGKGSSGSSATVDMALLDLSIYANPLKPEEVVSEITELSKIYGGDT